ncbi:MAG: dihydrolipoamide acetyltransferase family protein [Sporolactobacillus sp.]
MSEEKMRMPQLGESVTEGTISQWLIAAGDTVNKYDPIAEVTTDKVNAEVPSSFTGTITHLLAEEGETLPVGEPICAIEVASTINDLESVPATEKKLPEETVPAEDSAEKTVSSKLRYSPAVLRLAEQHQVDLKAISGTGRGGRITRKDVEKWIASADTARPDNRNERSEEIFASSESAAISSAPVNDGAGNKRASTIGASTGPNDHIVPLTGVRRAIANNMVRSKHEIPHAWMMIEVDVTNLVNYRNQIKGAFQKKEGSKLTYLPFFMKAIVAALKEYPRVNSTWAGDKIIEKKAVNISLAVASEDALYVPVIRDADEKSIKGLAFSINELAAKVRENRLSPVDMKGGTFTVNNTGSFGSIQSQPIINYPQAAILSIESIVKRPIVVNNMIAIRDMVNLCISIDHRVLDGLITGHFMARIKELLENISADNTPLY